MRMRVMRVQRAQDASEVHERMKRCQFSSSGVGWAESRKGEAYSAWDAREVVALLVGEPANDVEEGGKREEEDGGRRGQDGCHVCWRERGETATRGGGEGVSKYQVEMGVRDSVLGTRDLWRKRMEGAWTCERSGTHTEVMDKI